MRRKIDWDRWVERAVRFALTVYVVFWVLVLAWVAYCFTRRVASTEVLEWLSP